MEPKRTDPIPASAVRRLSLYLRQLQSINRKTISSKQLGASLNFTDAQVRKDLAYFGQFGHAGIGYRVSDLIAQLRKILGTDKTWNVLLVGAGNLGRALMAYNGFDAKGFRLVAVFDTDPAKIGKRQGPFPPPLPPGKRAKPESAKSASRRSFIIQPLTQIAEAITKHNIRLAILAVPAEHAQSVADQLAQSGIRGILNFAPVSLKVSADVALNSVDLAVQLEQLSFQANLPKAVLPSL
jgi:redox-sensing transcriptional repressor